MKKSQFAILIAVIVLCAGGIFGYVKYKLDKQESEKLNTDNNSGKNDTINNAKDFICGNSVVFEGKNYNYGIYRNNDDLVLQVNYNGNVFFEKKQLGYFIVNTADSNTICNDKTMNVYRIGSNDNHKYYSVKLSDISGLTIGYAVFDESQNNKMIIDLSEYANTGYINESTNEEVNNYRIIGNAVYVIELVNNEGHEIEYTFNNGTYSKRYTGVIYKGISGNK